MCILFTFLTVPRETHSNVHNIYIFETIRKRISQINSIQCAHTAFTYLKTLISRLNQSYSGFSKNSDLFQQSPN